MLAGHAADLIDTELGGFGPNGFGVVPEELVLGREARGCGNALKLTDFLAHHPATLILRPVREPLANRYRN